MITDILQIVLIMFFYLILRVILSIFMYKDYIIKNWGYYKCKPYIMPFAGFFGFDIEQNYNDCMFTSTAKNSTYSISPVINISNLMGDVLGDMGGSLNSIRGSLSDVQGFFGNILGGFTDKMTNIITTIQVLFIKVRSLIGKLLGIFTTLIYTLITTMATMTSMVTGPIGDLAGMCFSPDTYIVLDNKTLKKIKDISIEDKIEKGGNVISIMKFVNHNILYDVNGIFVSGSHLLFHNKEWKRVQDCGYTPIQEKYNPEFIYCLNTQYNIIECSNQIKNFLFRDFIETSNGHINNFVKETIISHLNKQDIKQFTHKEDKTLDYYTNGFIENTKIQLNNNQYKNISDINIGDITKKNGIVLGIIKHRNIYENIYTINNIDVSGNQIIYHNKTYKKVKSIKHIPYKKNNNCLYHIITSDQKIEINNTIFTDYLECNDENINNLIDSSIQKNIL